MNPDIFFYNPTCELAVANGSENFMANSLLRKMEYDLDLLPAFMARPEDIILVKKLPDSTFLYSLQDAGFPSFNLKLADESIQNPEFLSLPKHFLLPWGWSPAMHKFLEPLKPSCDPDFQNSPIARWKPVHKELYSRKEGRELLKKILENISCDWLTPSNELPHICTTHEQLKQLQRLWPSLIVKSPWSSSGRGLVVLLPGEYNQSNYQVISGIFKKQGFVMAEPAYQKMVNLSFQFYSHGNGKVDFLGICSFMTDHLGRYIGSYLQIMPEDLIPPLANFIQDHLETTRELLHSHLTGSRYATEYQGWLGVDALVYKTGEHYYKIQPCLEINCRYTMGAISLAIRNKVAEGSKGTFRIIHAKEGEVNVFFEKMKNEYPIVKNGNRITKGFLQLTPVTGDTRFGAYLHIF